MTLREANHLQAQPDSMDYWDGVDWSGEPARFSRSGKRRKAVSDLIDLAPHQAPKAPSTPRGGRKEVIWKGTPRDREGLHRSACSFRLRA